MIRREVGGASQSAAQASGQQRGQSPSHSSASHAEQRVSPDAAAAPVPENQALVHPAIWAAIKSLQTDETYRRNIRIAAGCVEEQGRLEAAAAAAAASAAAGGQGGGDSAGYSGAQIKRAASATFNSGEGFERSGSSGSIDAEGHLRNLDERERFYEMFEATGNLTDLVPSSDVRDAMKSAGMNVTANRVNRWLRDDGCEPSIQATIAGRQLRCVRGLKRRRLVGDAAGGASTAAGAPSAVGLG